MAKSTLREIVGIIVGFLSVMMCVISVTALIVTCDPLWAIAFTLSLIAGMQNI